MLDDEPMVGNVARRVLVTGGHEVTTVADGAGAIAAWANAMSTGQRFRLAILDLTIPGGLGGKEVVAEIRRMDPSALTIASSGYSMDPVMSSYEDHGFDARLPKPYTVQDLRGLVADLQAAEGSRRH